MPSASGTIWLCWCDPTRCQGAGDSYRHKRYPREAIKYSLILEGKHGGNLLTHMRTDASNCNERAAAITAAMVAPSKAAILRKACLGPS